MSDRRENPNALIQAPRELVRNCAVELSNLPGWQRNPCTSLKGLIYGLNSLFASYDFLKYRHGMRSPSTTLRELEGIRRWATGGNTARLSERLDDLESEGRDSFELLHFQLALELKPGHPERAASDEWTMVLLKEHAESEPHRIADLADRAMVNLKPLVQQGRGGNRNPGKIVQREIVFELGCIFAECTGRNPGITFDNQHNYNNFNGIHTGPFVRFVQIVSEELGHTLNGRQILNIYSSLDVPEWRSGKTGGWSAT